jgi:hypothetical protein
MIVGITGRENESKGQSHQQLLIISTEKQNFNAEQRAKQRCSINKKPVAGKRSNETNIGLSSSYEMYLEFQSEIDSALINFLHEIS